MDPFEHLPSAMVAHLLITVVFHINAFVWDKKASKALPPLTIVEVMVIDFNLKFRVTHGEFIQTCEGTDNTMSHRTMDEIVLGPCGNT